MLFSYILWSVSKFSCVAILGDAIKIGNHLENLSGHMLIHVYQG